jgi:hypothetical protein
MSCKDGTRRDREVALEAMRGDEMTGDKRRREEMSGLASRRSERRREERAGKEVRGEEGKWLAMIGRLN